MSALLDSWRPAIAERDVMEGELGASAMVRLPAKRPRPQITVILNWFDELRAKVPNEATRRRSYG